ncbi:MAG: RNA methyltransferase [Rhodocyclales bacterium]|nr:RNA methyltransferase [Rhodocyclales bacterium]
MKAISSRDNPRFKRLRKWATHHRARRDDGVILLDGLHLIEALQAVHGEIVEVAVAAGAAGKPEIAAWLAGHPRLDVLSLADGLFAEIAATETPSGIVAVARAPVPSAAPANDIDCLLLDGVQDPGNVGTLLRTAAAAGIRQALLGPGCADPWAPKTLRAGQGAQFLLAIHEGCDLAAFLAGFAGTGVVTRLDAARSLYETSLDGPLAWVFGAEGQGVSAPVAKAAKLGVFIPMPGGTESLNVAAAAAVCLFEVVRRRGN